MTRIDFFFNVADKNRQAVALSEKAVIKSRRLLLFVPDQSTVQAITHLLWQQSPTSFLPHCSCTHSLAADTPIIVDWQGAESLPHHDVLINLQDDHPAFFSRFTRLIEIVGQDESDKQRARVRYKFYRDRGYELRSFDASGAAL